METEIVSNPKSDRGFTLVELLIVIVILGILATVTVFAVRGMTDKAKTNTCAADKKAMEVAVEGFYAQNGAYASSGGAETVVGGVVTVTGLVPSFLRAASPNYNTDNTGAVFAITGNPNGCA